MSYSTPEWDSADVMDGHIMVLHSCATPRWEQFIEFLQSRPASDYPEAAGFFSDEATKEVAGALTFGMNLNAHEDFLRYSTSRSVK